MSATSKDENAATMDLVKLPGISVRRWHDGRLAHVFLDWDAPLHKVRFPEANTVAFGSCEQRVCAGEIRAGLEIWIRIRGI